MSFCQTQKQNGNRRTDHPCVGVDQMRLAAEGISRPHSGGAGRGHAHDLILAETVAIRLVSDSNAVKQVLIA